MSTLRPGVAQWLRRCAISRMVPGRVTGDFFRSIHVSGVDSASKNEYHDIPGGKGGRCVGVTTFMCRVSRNLGALTFWIPLGHAGL